jgi:Fe-S-cluster containining protein
LRFENVVFPDGVGFRCKTCGYCCRQPPDVNFKEQKRIEVQGFIDFMEEADNRNNRLVRRNGNGKCFFQDEKGLCVIHDVKPAVCTLWPFMITDYNYEENLIELDLTEIAISTCKGITLGTIDNIEEIGKAAQTILKEFSEMVAKRARLPVTDKEVPKLTRKFIITLNLQGLRMTREGIDTGI